MSDGGPAFPFPSGPEPRVDAYHDRSEGMSLRDWFAGLAMQGIQSSYTEGYPDTHMLAEKAYQYADAMIARRAYLSTNESPH